MQRSTGDAPNLTDGYSERHRAIWILMCDVRGSGWHCSADRTCLRLNSLQTGNFTGKCADLAALPSAMAQKTLLPPRIQSNTLAQQTGNLIQKAGIFRSDQGFCDAIRLDQSMTVHFE
jgi:hypothetical protein